MHIDKEYLSKAFLDLEENLTSYSLPMWDELPDIDLYMDQVVSILNKYLNIFYEKLGEEKAITPSMINNYVKLKIIPPPEKKKYSKVHLAYLLILCTLKQTLDIATIQKIIPVNILEDEVKITYNSFVKNQKKAFSYVIENTKTVVEPILKFESHSQERLNDLLMQVSASANIFKIFTEKITRQ